MKMWLSTFPYLTQLDGVGEHNGVGRKKGKNGQSWGGDTILC